jgi:hypothetical protein
LPQDLESVGQDVVQAEIDTEEGRVALFGLRYLNLDVDVPTPAGVGAELPRFRLAARRCRAGKPKITIETEDGQFTASDFAGLLKLENQDGLLVVGEQREADRLRIWSSTRRSYRFPCWSTQAHVNLDAS